MSKDDCSWSLPPEPLTLPPDQVHVWQASLVQLPETVRRLGQTLSEAELARAARFHFERDRQAFIVARGALRLLVAGYLICAPDDVQFTYGPHQKPALAHPETRPQLYFNVSHSHRQALFAFNWGREIGVDIEQIRPLSDDEAIARRFFSARDYETFIALPDHLRAEGFFNCWTRKEAYIKALGDGLTHPLDAFDVTLKPGDPARLLAVRGAPDEVARWSMTALTPASGYSAALVIEGHNWQLACWQWAATEDENSGNSGEFGGTGRNW